VPLELEHGVDRVTRERTIDSASAEETAALGERLGALLEAGDVLLLDGPLGAGKTALTQGIARGVGVPPERRVASPTFTLVNEHPGRVPLFHLDLYRIEDPGELVEIGVEEALGPRGVAVVEWAERLGPAHTPRERLEIHIDITGPEARRLRFVAVGARPEAVLRAFFGQAENGEGR
jgi:tRNA threonylcarbamoyladenosine biosynthesis protein TsaE